MEIKEFVATATLHIEGEDFSSALETYMADNNVKTAFEDVTGVTTPSYGEPQFIAVVWDVGEIRVPGDTIVQATQHIAALYPDDSAILEIRRVDYRDIGN